MSRFASETLKNQVPIYFHILITYFQVFAYIKETPLPCGKIRTLCAEQQSHVIAINRSLFALVLISYLILAIVDGALVLLLLKQMAAERIRKSMPTPKKVPDFLVRYL
jgi:hypothetical protein